VSDLPEYGLTICDPWAQAIIWGPKRVENRTWCPPEKVIGERLAIGVSQTVDENAALSLRDRVSGGFGLFDRIDWSSHHDWICEQANEHDVPATIGYRHHPGHIIGSVKVVGFLDERGDDPVAVHEEDSPQGCASMWPSEVSDDNWYVGPVGWALFDPEPLDEPAPVRGRPGVWHVGDQIREAQK
jgi:hypothetical protein